MNATLYDPADVAAAELRRLHARVQELERDLETVAAVAITMLFDTHPADVKRAFSIPELEQVCALTEPLGSEQVEDIYRRAWLRARGAPQPPAGASNAH